MVRDLPGVGENLQDHLQIRLIYETRRPITTNDQLRTLAGRARIGLQWLLFRDGPLAVGINQGGLFCRVDPASATPDTQFHFATLSADMAGGKVHPFSGCTYSVCQLRPSSRGRALRSADPFEAPSMQPNYLSTELDRRMAVAAVKYARRLAAAEPLAGLMKREFRPGPGCAKTTRSCTSAANTAPPSFILRARPRWGRPTIRWQWWTSGCACAAWPDCAWSTARSCRRWCRATRMRP